MHACMHAWALARPSCRSRLEGSQQRQIDRSALSLLAFITGGGVRVSLFCPSLKGRQWRAAVREFGFPSSAPPFKGRRRSHVACKAWLPSGVRFQVCKATIPSLSLSTLLVGGCVAL